MAQEHEKRTFFRIHDCLVVEFRQITSEDFTKIKDIIQCNPTQAFDSERGIRLPVDKEPTGKQKEFFAYMHMLNKKLDMIIDTLSGSQSSGTYHTVRGEISLSGAGIRFETQLALMEGDYTELKMIVPVFPYPKITILCQVVRAERAEEGAEGTFIVAMKFIVVNENDRDFLIKYIFEKERELLRQRRETTGQ
jgi:hypothetical protein